MAISSKKIADKPQVMDEDKQPGVVYIGHVPHGFHERQLRHYFSQFGSVLAVKLSRSQKTGKSKGYAFVKFRYAAVAKTVAETCHNYLFFNKLLKCEYRPLSEVHKDTFHSYKWKVNYKSKRLHNSAKDQGKLEKSVQKSVRRKQSKLNTLKKLGIELALEDVMNVPEVAVKKPESSTEAE
ncbi:hypothetical protein BsWGS_25819 [Bradybaena similaris]